MINEHVILLESLYDVSSNIPDGVLDTERFRFDSERRIMDLSRLLWKYWPITSIFMRAKYGDGYILEIAKSFSETGFNFPNVEKALSMILHNFLYEKNELLMLEMVKYENIKKGVLEETELASEEIKSKIEERIPDFRVAKFSFDTINFEKTIQFYAQLHAPDLFIRRLEPTLEKSIYAIYKKKDRIFAVNITNLI